MDKTELDDIVGDLDELFMTLSVGIACGKPFTKQEASDLCAIERWRNALDQYNNAPIRHPDTLKELKAWAYRMLEKHGSSAEDWETGRLGADERYAVVVSDELNEKIESALSANPINE